ncbi:MAG TPA: alpha/beta hydrolase [Candidatus Binataceae bacterium]|jgi:pimeloyl-ACP methyl ester carboxylesterase|nr:alpha/beta hydrolase [Candidatus Binataceae bacterium]
MPFFDSDGIRIHYLDEGRGAPVVMVHGFGLSALENWTRTGMVERLARRARVLALDVRGHGESDKPHDPALYGLGIVSGDIVRLLGHLGIERTRIVGYSMGSRIALEMLMRHQGCLSAAVLGGFGVGGQIRVPGQRNRIAAALLEEDPAMIEDVMARRFRRGAERNGKDLRALAAYISAEETTDAEASVDFAALARLRIPVMVATGDRDAIAGDPRPLAGWFPDARIELIEGGDHVSVPADVRFQQAVERFIAALPK